VLNCYWLAEHFHQHPKVFLDLPLSEVRMHVSHTLELIEVREKARRDAERDRE